uniref:CAP-Gly domain-containing protein n=1 Tax=Denticeps clupeoides TaxID=299321 RepID=A0AAY4EYJ1_9TELE
MQFYSTEHKVEVIIPIHSNDKEKNPQYAQNTGSFTPPHKRSTSVSERIKLKQGPALSSDIKDDNDHLILGDNLKEMTVKPSYDLADLKTDCYTAKTGTETQNHIQINNNHDNRLTYDDRQKEKDATKTDPENEKNISTDPLASFKIGDRVLVYRSKPGVLKYKGETTFASGVWAGVALDLRNGNHNGTFKGVQYFKCDENCGVLVKAEDVSYFPGGFELLPLMDDELMDDRHCGH